MKKSIRIILISIIILLTIGITQVNAGSATIKANKTETTVGDNVTITVSITGAAWNVKINGGGITDTIAGYNEDAENETKTKTYNLDTSSAGTYTVKISGDVTDADETKIYPDQSVTVKVTAPTPVEDPKPAEETPPATTEKPSTTTEAPVQETPKEEPKLSSNSKLKMLGIRPNDFSNFKSSVTTYYVTVPYEVSEVEVYAEKQESSQKISGTTDSMSLKVGSNTAKVTCTAEDGTTKTYTIYITREEEVKETVKEEPEEETPPVVEEIKTEEETDVAEFIGKEKVLGITAIKVIAKVEEGKDYEPELMPEFRESEYEYQVAVPLTATEVEVNVESDTEATIEVMGNKDLKEGINNVTVMVKIGEDTKIYQIVVNKVEMKPVSTLSDELISQLAVIAAIATAIIVAIIVLVIAIIRSRKKNKVVETDTKVETTEQMQEENMEAGQEQKDENKEE